MNDGFPEIALLFAWLFGGALAGWALTGIVTSRLRANAVLDRPVHRSSHQLPTPRGGGWGFVIPTFVALAAFAIFGEMPPVFAVCIGAAALVTISWWDDLRSAAGRHVPIAARLAVQGLAVAVPLFLLPPDQALAGNVLPLWVERLLLAAFWLWLINLFNFMDGIDTLAAGEGIAIAAGLIVIAAVMGLTGVAFPRETSPIAVALAGSLLGFLVWNFPPAKVFMGDVGSVFLGYVIGFLLLQAALDGAWAAALILPIAFIGDATTTLLKRLSRGEKIWQAHREHAYQRAVQRGESHGAVSLQFMALNLVLIALAVASLLYPWASLGAALVLTLAFLLWLGRGR